MTSAAAAMQITLGRPFRQEDVDEGLARLRDVLKEEGLYTAQVSAENVPYPATHQMDILVHVKPGTAGTRRIGGTEKRHGVSGRGYSFAIEDEGRTAGDDSADTARDRQDPKIPGEERATQRACDSPARRVQRGEQYDAHWSSRSRKVHRWIWR